VRVKNDASTNGRLGKAWQIVRESFPTRFYCGQTSHNPYQPIRTYPFPSDGSWKPASQRQYVYGGSDIVVLLGDIRRLTSARLDVGLASRV
jgi:hypothetical protein